MKINLFVQLCVQLIDLEFVFKCWRFLRRNGFLFYCCFCWPTRGTDVKLFVHKTKKQLQKGSDWIKWLCCAFVKKTFFQNVKEPEEEDKEERQNHQQPKWKLSLSSIIWFRMNVLQSENDMVTHCLCSSSHKKSDPNLLLVHTIFYIWMHNDVAHQVPAVTHIQRKHNSSANNFCSLSFLTRKNRKKK